MPTRDREEVPKPLWVCPSDVTATLRQVWEAAGGKRAQACFGLGDRCSHIPAPPRWDVWGPCSRGRQARSPTKDPPKPLP